MMLKKIRNLIEKIMQNLELDYFEYQTAKNLTEDEIKTLISYFITFDEFKLNAQENN